VLTRVIFAPAAGSGATRRKIQLPRLPRVQPFAQLLGIHLRAARRAVRLAHEDRRRFVRAIAAASLDVHRDEDVGA